MECLERAKFLGRADCKIDACAGASSEVTKIQLPELSCIHVPQARRLRRHPSTPPCTPLLHRPCYGNFDRVSPSQLQRSSNLHRQLARICWTARGAKGYLFVTVKTASNSYVFSQESPLQTSLRARGTPGRGKLNPSACACAIRRRLMCASFAPPKPQAGFDVGKHNGEAERRCEKFGCDGRIARSELLTKNCPTSPKD